MRSVTIDSGIYFGWLIINLVWFAVAQNLSIWLCLPFHANRIHNISDNYWDSLKKDRFIRIIIQVFHFEHIFIEIFCKMWENKLEISKHRWIIQCPFTRCFHIPFWYRQRMRYRQPVSVYFEVSRPANVKRMEIYRVNNELVI